FKVLLDLLE
ncbi:collagen triple helix repeat family protein, partial [Clostridium sporogenes]